MTPPMISPMMLDPALRYRLDRIPQGLPDDTTWRLTHEPPRAPREKEVLVAVRYLSVDPAMATWVQPVRSYAEPVRPGEVMRAFGIGEVVESGSDRYRPGDHVFGFTGVQTDATIPAAGLRKIDPDLMPLPKYLGGLGWTAFTAFFGLTEIGQPKEGETVVVSAAAGAVGSVACQVARLLGARVVAIAGGEKKCAWLRDELGFEAVVDYKREPIGPALDRHAPEGIDVYFDNVGGEILDAVLERIRRQARIVLCGGISQYGTLSGARGPASYLQLVAQSGTMRGFTMLDYLSRIPEAGMKLGGWILEGKLVTREHVLEGIESFPRALAMLFTGENQGKLMIRV